MIFAEEDKEFIQQILDFTGQKYSLHDDARIYHRNLLIELTT